MDELQSRKHYVAEFGNKDAVEDDIDRLLNAISRGASSGFGPSLIDRHASLKSAMKRPVRSGYSQASGVGIVEPVSLKQALRGLCISQASETAATKKRLAKPGCSSGIPGYRTRVVEANSSTRPQNRGKGHLEEIFPIREMTLNDAQSMPKTLRNNETCNHNCKLKSTSVGPSLARLVLRNRGFIRKKVKQVPTAETCCSYSYDREDNNNLGPKNSCLDSATEKCTLENGRMDDSKASPASRSTDCSVEGILGSVVLTHQQSVGSEISAKTNALFTKADVRSKSGEKGEFSQTSASSIGDYSSSTSTSEESNLSGSSRTRPHMSNDSRWEAIHTVRKQHGILSLRHFKVVKKLGSGDIGTVYLAELSGTNGLFALKVMDNESLISRKKILKTETEKEILQMLDHPFLPTLYAHFTTDKNSCLVMEYCPGGDLHVLRQRQPNRNFPEQTTRFYAAEVLLALEYLHMLGVVYRDLKPENILIREDGHIMLSDFDLSMRCSVNPVMLKSNSIVSATENSYPCGESSCIDPLCLNPPCQVPCFTPRLLSLSLTSKSWITKSDPTARVRPMPQLVAEPTSARSNSFVGTHEYLAPEIIKGKGHGNAVDWWTFGVFLFELLYGKTPFKGSSGNDGTLANVVSRTIKFPCSPIVSFQARDLIQRLLVKEPRNRLGSVKGAAEIKQHPFFEGVNWPLIRCAIPPEMLRFYECEDRGDTGESIEFDMF